MTVDVMKTLDELRSTFEGVIVTEADDTYEEARFGWNAMIDRRPAAILHCANEDDVVRGVEFARTTGLPLAVRGGGHSVAGKSTCDHGVVLDLRLLSHVDVDPVGRTAHVGGGALLGEVDRAVQEHGLVVPAGVVSHTGAGGLTLGGGVGWLTRKFGLTCDSLLACRVVLADGSIVTADAENHSELFWGLRGGGGNFGVVTEFVYRCHELPTVIPVGVGFWTLEHAKDVLQAHRDAMPSRPDEWKATTFVLRAPPIDGIPAEVVGEPVLMVVQVWAADDLPAATEAFESLVRTAPPLLARIEPTRYLDLQTRDDAVSGHGQANYTKGGYLAEFSDGAIDALLAGARDLSNATSIIEIIPHGGRQLAVGEHETAFSDRATPYSFNVYSRWPLDDVDPDRHMRVARNSYSRLEEFATGGVYTNFFAEDDDHDRVVAAYGREKYDRLAELKGEYDPDNLFALNGNIVPTTRKASGVVTRLASPADDRSNR